MTGVIQVLSDKGEAIAEKSFLSRIAYMSNLAHLMENFPHRRIEITFDSCDAERTRHHRVRDFLTPILEGTEVLDI